MPAISTALMAAVAIAAFISMARLPSARATAAIIDRNLELHDCVVTAVQCAASEDAFSQLVLRDAVMRLARVRRSEAFPLEVPRAAVLTPLVACLVIGAAARLPTLSEFGFARRGPESSTSSAKAVANQGRAAVAANPAGTAPTAPSTNSAPPGASVTPAPQPEGSGEPRESVREESPGSSTGSVGSQKAPDTLAATATGLEPRSSDRGAGGRGSAASRDASRAGGVSGSDAASPREASIPNAPPAGASYAGAYRSGRAAAETAIAQDRIPRERRAYVRDYFNAIRPRDQQ
jgi:hypothetical protein